MVAVGGGGWSDLVMLLIDCCRSKDTTTCYSSAMTFFTMYMCTHSRGRLEYLFQNSCCKAVLVQIHTRTFSASSVLLV